MQTEPVICPCCGKELGLTGARRWLLWTLLERWGKLTLEELARIIGRRQADVIIERARRELTKS